MILYHGSNTAIDGIDLNRCRPYKDFGRGFYLTDIREQAQRMAARTARMFSGNPTLTMFEFDLEEAQSSELKVKVFKEPDWEWARFVMSNRDINTNTAKFLFEGISADVVRYLVERNDMDLQEAISTFHNSETFVKLEDFSTGLYIESPAYVYDLLMSELKNGKLVQ